MSDKFWNSSISGPTQTSLAEILGVEKSMSIRDMRDVTGELSGGFNTFSFFILEPSSPIPCFQDLPRLCFCVLRFLWRKKTTASCKKKKPTGKDLHVFLKGKLPWEIGEAGESSADFFFGLF